MPRRRKAAHDRMGFIDYCRVNTDGVVTCGGDDEGVKSRIQAGVGTKKYSKVKRNKEGEIFPETNTHTGIPEWNRAGAPLFTSTSKVHAPTFGITAGSTCPKIQYPVMTWLAKALNEPQNRDLRDPTQVSKMLAEAVPKKCLACYATQNTYRQAETKRAMMNRQLWWDNTSDKEIEDTLVEAIKHAGNEECVGHGEDSKCTFTQGVQTKLFRAFDSGDFQAPRDIRIWHKVAARLPGTKFWFPTTTAAGVCGATPAFNSEMLRELKKLHQRANVTVRPSAEGVDIPAAVVPGLGAGTAVVEPLKPEQVYYKGRGKWTKVCDVKNPKKCDEHYVCPGNCASCRACWNRNIRVVYQRHGAEAVAKNIVSLVRRTTGTEPYNRDLPGGKPVAHVHEQLNQTSRKLFGKLLSKLWQGPTEQFVAVVEEALPMKSGREVEAERKGMSLDEYERELVGKKAARRAAKEAARAARGR